MRIFLGPARRREETERRKRELARYRGLDGPVTVRAMTDVKLAGFDQRDPAGTDGVVADSIPGAGADDDLG
jgi:hypothetical protein